MGRWDRSYCNGDRLACRNLDDDGREQRSAAIYRNIPHPRPLQPHPRPFTITQQSHKIKGLKNTMKSHKDAKKYKGKIEEHRRQADVCL